MKYILQTLKDIEQVLSEDLVEFTLFGETYLPKLPESSKVIEKALSYYKRISLHDQCEKEPIMQNEFIPDDATHSYVINYKILNDSIDLDVLRSELASSVSIAQEFYFSELYTSVEKAESTFLSMQSINDAISELQNGVLFLKGYNNDKNPVLKILAQVYMSSYSSSLITLENKYSTFYPQLFVVKENTSSRMLNVRMMIKPDKETVFFEYERMLRNRGYIINWNIWNKSIKELLEFFLYCKYYGVFSSYALEEGRGVKFFEKRYNKKVGDQGKPSKYNKYKDYRKTYYFL